MKDIKRKDIPISDGKRIQKIGIYLGKFIPS